jgi:hypothetical protein
VCDYIDAHHYTHRGGSRSRSRRRSFFLLYMTLDTPLIGEIDTRYREEDDLGGGGGRGEEEDLLQQT